MGWQDNPVVALASGPSAWASNPEMSSPQKKVGTAEDIGKSALAGLGQGFAALAGGAGDIGDVIGASMRAVGIPTRDTSRPLPDSVTLPGGMLGAVSAAPNSRTVNNDIQSVAGSYHQPQTVYGDYARTGASFLPAALFPGSGLMRAARVAVPALTSETAGQFTKGTSAEPYARFAGAVLGGGVTEGAPLAFPTVARVANRGVSALTAGKTQLLDPATEAERRIREAFVSDGGPIAAGKTAASYASGGGSTPALLDVGGGSVRRLVRAAAGGGGDAHNIATNYADQIRADLQDNAAAAVNRMAPGNTTAAQTEAALTKGQSDLAGSQYAEPYAQPATVTPQMVDALQGPEGRGAINRAYAAARAHRNIDQMGELKDLTDVAAEQSGGQNPLTGQRQSMAQALTNLSAGSLDRVRIAMRETGRALSAKGSNDIAGGYFGRVKDIDTALDQTPGLTDARANYRQAQQGIDAVPHGQTILTMPSDQYAAETARFAGVGGPPNIGTGLQAGAKQAILDSIERPAAGQTGVLNRLAASTGVERNLSNTFGIGKTAVFRQAIRNEVQRLRNANFVSPETGSQTAPRSADQGLLSGIPTSLGNLMSSVADKFLRGVSLTPAERAEIVKLGTSEADLRRFATLPPSRMMQPRAVGLQAASAISQGNTQ